MSGRQLYALVVGPGQGRALLLSGGIGLVFLSGVYSFVSSVGLGEGCALLWCGGGGHVLGVCLGGGGAWVHGAGQGWGVLPHGGVDAPVH